MIAAIVWVLLKALPSLAGVTGLPAGRASIYALLAALLVLLLVSAIGRGIPRHWHGFGLLTALFLVVVLLHVGEIVPGAGAAMTLLNARALFLALALVVLVAQGVPAGRLLGLLAAYIAFVQITSVALSAALLVPGLARLGSPERLAGIYAGSFTLGYTAAAAIGALGIAYTHLESRALRGWVALGIGAAVGNSFLAVNRTSLAAVVALAVGWLIERLSRADRRSFANTVLGTLRAAGVVALVAAVLALVVVRIAPDAAAAYVETWRFRIAALGDTHGQSVRWLTIDAGLRMFEAHPFIGVGWDNAAQLSLRFGATFSSTAHNAFVQAMAEGGVFGLAYAIALLLVIPGRLWWRGRATRGRWIFAGAWTTVVAFNMIASNLHLEAHWDVLFVWVLVAGLADRAAPTPSALRPADRLVVAPAADAVRAGGRA